MKTSRLCLTFLTFLWISELYPFLAPVQEIVFGNDCSSEGSSSGSFVWPRANYSASLRFSDQPWNGNNVCLPGLLHRITVKKDLVTYTKQLWKWWKTIHMFRIVILFSISYILIPKFLGLDDSTVRLFISETHQMPDANTFSPLRKENMNW